jgi:hypothetical protein
MAIKIKMDVMPFPVPDDVKVEVVGLKQDGPKPLPTYPLSALDYYGLDKLCRDFRREVFKKAKVRDIDPIYEQKHRDDDNGYGK